MSEPRKNHLNIAVGEQEDGDGNIDSYKPILEVDTEVQAVKSNLSKSKEKVSLDGAEEKLLQKEKEAKIVTRVDMADAKYVVEDHRNGDARIELDASKKQFSGLSKEELLRYADDPFWVRLRWCMFVLFWALWLCMLIGAVTIIVRAPKCAPPPPKKWFEKGPLVDMSYANNFQEIEDRLLQLQSAKVQGVFIPATLVGETYDVIDETKPNILEQFKTFAEKAHTAGVRVIVDLTANFVSKTHHWFTLSENKTEEFSEYFVWAKGGDFVDAFPSTRTPPNNWISTLDEPAWTLSDRRGEFYLHQYGADQPDLNFTNVNVVRRFDGVLKKWMQAGASGVRLLKARQLLVNQSLPSEGPVGGAGGAGTGLGHGQYGYLQHQHTSDQSALDDLLHHWAHIVDTHAVRDTATGSSVFTLLEEGSRPELWLLSRNWSSLRPPSAAPVSLAQPAHALAATLIARLDRWPAIQMVASRGQEAAAVALLLPAAPVFEVSQLAADSNDTQVAEWFSRLVSLREDASIAHGNVSIQPVPNVNGSDHLLACARWKMGHTGYAVVWNPGHVTARANLTGVPSVPDVLTVHHVSAHVHDLTNYTSNQPVGREELVVPALSAVVLSYVPWTEK